MVLVTGARRGIGRPTAVRLAKEGLRVVLVSRSGPARLGSGCGELGAVVEEIRKTGGHAKAVRIDLPDRRGMDVALDAIATEWDPPGVLVNNALCEQPGAQELIAAMDIDAFAEVLLGEVPTPTVTSAAMSTLNSSRPRSKARR